MNLSPGRDKYTFFQDKIARLLSGHHSLNNSANYNFEIVAISNESELLNILLDVFCGEFISKDDDFNAKTAILRHFSHILNLLCIYSNYDYSKVKLLFHNNSLPTEIKNSSCLDTQARDISKFFGSCQLFNRHVMWVINPEFLGKLKSQYQAIEVSYISNLLHSNFVVNFDDFFFCLTKIIVRSMEFEDLELTINLSKILVEGFLKQEKKSNLQYKTLIEDRLNTIIPESQTIKIISELLANKM